MKEDINNEQDLQTLAISISVTDTGGNEFDAATLQIPSVFGDIYNMEVRYEEDTFVVWQIHDNGIETRLALE